MMWLIAKCYLDILEQIEQPIEQVFGDGSYDTIAERGAIATIPPRSNAKIQQHLHELAQPHPRD
jgi:hypothetical protein